MDAISEVVARGDVGYPAMAYREAYEAAYTDWAKERFGAAPMALKFLPDVVTGLFWTMRTLAPAGSGVAILVPSYPPFYEAIEATGHRVAPVPIVEVGGRFEIDFESMSCVLADPGVASMILCNPHNPTGRVFSREELIALADLALANRVTVISDEIHHDIIGSGYAHIPFNSLDHEAAARSVVISAPSKTFNLAGLKAAHLEVGDPGISRQLSEIPDHERGESSLLGLVAATAAYRYGSQWLDETLDAIRSNTELALSVLRGTGRIGAHEPEGTYLLWGNVENLGSGSAFDFFLEKARVAVSPGESFDAKSSSWFRLNLATYPEVMSEILNRMAAAF